MLRCILGVGLDDLGIAGLQVLAAWRLHLDNGLVLAASRSAAGMVEWRLAIGVGVAGVAVHGCTELSGTVDEEMLFLGGAVAGRCFWDEWTVGGC